MKKVFWALPILLFLCASAHAQNYANASGGEVTPIVLNMTPTTKWVVFVGNVTAQGTISPLSVPDPDVDSGRQVSLASTNQYYWLSDSPSPSLSTLASANLSRFDQKYHLSGISSAVAFFNETNNFSLLEPYGPNGNHWLEGATTYFAGRNASGSNDASAFMQGLFQSGDDFVFLVPVSNSSLSNGEKYDFVFILPYGDLQGDNIFYLFSTISPPADSGGGIVKQPVPYRWAYDEAGLHVYTVPYALIMIQNPSRSTINDNADIFGNARFTLQPGDYHMTIIASGYLQAEQELHLKALANRTAERRPPIGQKDVEFQNATGIQRVCFDGECYFRTGDSLSAIDDIKCAGGICRYIGDNLTEFIVKYDFRKDRGASLNRGPAAASNAPYANIDQILSGFGADLSSFVRAGGDSQASGPTAVIAAITIFVALSAVFIWRSNLPARKGGHD